jgi:hypothetical protein
MNHGCLSSLAEDIADEIRRGPAPDRIRFLLDEAAALEPAEHAELWPMVRAYVEAHLAYDEATQPRLVDVLSDGHTPTPDLIRRHRAAAYGIASAMHEERPRRLIEDIASVALVSFGLMAILTIFMLGGILGR